MPRDPKPKRNGRPLLDKNGPEETLAVRLRRAVDKYRQADEKLQTAVRNRVQAKIHEKRSDENRREQVIALAVEFAAARAACQGDDRAFGRWLAENGCDDIESNERAALVNIGQHRDVAEPILRASASRSVRLIWENEVRPTIFPSAGKDARRGKKADAKKEPTAPAQQPTTGAGQSAKPDAEVDNGAETGTVLTLSPDDTAEHIAGALIGMLGEKRAGTVFRRGLAMVEGSGPPGPAGGQPPAHHDDGTTARAAARASKAPEPSPAEPEPTDPSAWMTRVLIWPGSPAELLDSLGDAGNGRPARTYRASPPLPGDETSGFSCKKWQNAGIVSNGEVWTMRLPECRSGHSQTSLASVLETGEVPAKYDLSPRACAGIIRRAERAGKAIPGSLLRALRERAGSGPTTSPAGDRPPEFVVAIQDGRDVEKAQGGAGIGEDGGVAYTLDTLGAQAVAFAQNQAGEVRASDRVGTLGTNGNASGRATPMVMTRRAGKAEADATGQDAGAGASVDQAADGEDSGRA